MPRVHSLRAGDLAIDVEETAAPPTLRLSWRGKSNERNPRKTLAPFFGLILGAAAAGRRLVEMHFHALEHFNSSTITSVIELIQEARQKRVPLVIMYDAAVTWQKVTFEAMRVFNKGDGLLELRPS
jgi:hypothetical protein